MTTTLTVGQRDNVDARAYIKSTFEARAIHRTAEAVQTTVSFARAERLLGREYHGRFLIELLQNAADAWRTRRRSGARARVAILIVEGPALIVANQGESFPAKVVVESLGHIGRSTKPWGEAIGHKGIGFKSVLEVSLTPELYSGLQASMPELAVRFDPRDALKFIKASSPEWTSHLNEIDELRNDELSAVPTLRFPQWVETLPEPVSQLAEAGFDTAVVLPFDAAFSDRLRLDETQWLAAVRQAMDDITDEILVLLGVFEEVQMEDRIAGTSKRITPTWTATADIGNHTHREIVNVRRDELTTSSWHLYRRAISDSRDISGEIAVGLRLAAAASSISVVPAIEGEDSASFHLFFPTKIGSGLPLLLHGYFEVNASRTGFYDGSGPLNQAILDSLAELVGTAVADAAVVGHVDLSSLVELLARAPEPEDSSARSFKESVLRHLDETAWVPLSSIGNEPSFGKPTEVFADPDRGALIKMAASAFSASYVFARTNFRVADPRISDDGLAFLGSRRGPDAHDFWSLMGLLLRPGAVAPWPAGAEDEGFRSLLDLVTSLDSTDRRATTLLLDGLRGDPASRLLPAVAADGGRTLLALPDPVEGVAGRRSRMVMARVTLAENALVPPAALDLAFLPDGMLRSEAEIDRAKPLGVRPFTVDNVLDRLGTAPSSTSDCEGLVRFLWALLARERRSEFGTRISAQRADTFEPQKWFWLQPGRAEGADSEQDRQRRERYLAAVMLPSRNEEWRPSGELAFGADWADWIEKGACGRPNAVSLARIDGYRALDAVSASGAQMLASPAVILALLRDAPVLDAGQGDDDAEVELDEERLNVERHAFLLRLGVWEVIPVEGFESRAIRGRPQMPWSGTDLDRQMKAVEGRGGWRFSWSGGSHQKVWVAEDFRFQWDLTAAADQDAIRLAQSLALGVGLYRNLSLLSVFCPKCSDRSRHQVTYRSSPRDRYPSTLSIQLQTTPWVPAVRNGSFLERPLEPALVWWVASLPVGAALQQSPWRFLPTCAPLARISADLRELAGIPTAETADLRSIAPMLRQLREQFVSGELQELLGSSSSRQSILGLHRLAYERLSELAALDGSGVAELLDDVHLLCDVGGAYGYFALAECRHDDGRFATYRRLFLGSVPFVVIAREKAPIAQRLGIAPFVVSVARRGTDEGRDVTDELSDIVGRRVPELLSIVAHHGLGTQTLDPASEEFKKRSDRLANLRFLQVPDLVLDAQVEGTTRTATIGQGSVEELFLEGPTSSHPRIFHDLVGEQWELRFRRKVAPLLAAIVENPAYAATFSLFLQADTDHERESVLQDLAITPEDVDAIRGRLGALTDEERAAAQRWFRAILGMRNAKSVDVSDAQALHDALIDADFDVSVAGQLVAIGGGDAVRRDDSREGALWMLSFAGIDLYELDRRLRSADSADGLVIRASRGRLREWASRYGRRVAAVLALRTSPDDAKASVVQWEAPADLALNLDPPLDKILAPVVASLRSLGFEPDVDRLISGPEAELARIAGVSVPELDRHVERLYNAEEQDRLLRASAASWRRELVRLGVLARTTASDTRTAIRVHAAEVEQLLPASPATPSALLPALELLFSAHPNLVAALADLLVDSLSAAPSDPGALRQLALENGLRVELLATIEQALENQGRELVRQVRDRMRMLKQRGLEIQTPTELRVLVSGRKTTPGPGPKSVTQIDIGGEVVDERKRRLGDEGERLALAAVIAPLLALGVSARRRALAEIEQLLLSMFSGAAVDRARAHVGPAGEPNLEEDERIEHLEALLRVSPYPGFGFDLLGWLSPGPGLNPTAIALEVKSSADGEFHLSPNEWETAQRFSSDDCRYLYAVVVVLRGPRSVTPARLDLLTDPVALVAANTLTMDPDGYKVKYKATMP